MSSYTSLTALKESLGSADALDDGVLTSAIIRASGLVDSYLKAIRPGYVGIAAGSNFSNAVGSNTRIYHGTGTDTLFIDDAMSIASVTVDSVLITSTAYVAEPLNSVPKRYLTYVLPFTSVQGLRPSAWNPGTGNVSVVGYFGLNFVPDDIAQVTLELARLVWVRYMDNKPAPTGPNDDEARAILEGLDWGWRLDMVAGAGTSFGGTSSGGITYGGSIG